MKASHLYIYDKMARIAPSSNLANWFIVGQMLVADIDVDVKNHTAKVTDTKGNSVILFIADGYFFPKVDTDEVK